MPSLFRFIVIVGTLGALASGALYVLANRFEPAQQEETKVVPGVKIKKQ